jgi:hypothetical protein
MTVFELLHYKGTCFPIKHRELSSMLSSDSSCLVIKLCLLLLSIYNSNFIEKYGISVTLIGGKVLIREERACSRLTLLQQTYQWNQKNVCIISIYHGFLSMLYIVECFISVLQSIINKFSKTTVKEIINDKRIKKVLLYTRSNTNLIFY